MYALELNIAIAPCNWVCVTEIYSLEILFRSHRKNNIYAAYVHTFYYINSWASIIRFKSSGVLCSFNCAAVIDVSRDQRAFMCRIKESKKSQFSFLFLFVLILLLLCVLSHFCVPFLVFSWGLLHAGSDWSLIFPQCFLYLFTFHLI
jgi:hypothetical protein